MRPEPLRILIAVADAQFAAATKRTLGAFADVTSVERGEPALELLLCEDWNILITDLQLPGVGGLELVHTCRCRDHAPVALVLCEEGSLDDAVEAMRAGASDFIRRPIAPQQLLAKIADAAEIDRENARRRAPAERVLAIGAHPDDVEIGCGGALLRHRDAGQAITILTMTGGEAGGERGVRAAEARNAASLLSARLQMLAFDDTEISETRATVQAIAAIVEEVRPTTVYTHSAHDVHQDHRRVHFATLVAARSVPLLFGYLSPSATVDFRPNRFVSIDDVLERKLALIEPYESQTQIRDYLQPGLLRATARYWGRFGPSDYAEPLEVIRESDLGLSGEQQPVGVSSPVRSEAHAVGRGG